MTNSTALKENILKLADHCVKCGLCSSQCPTYLLNQDENESPRGRIALAQALASDAVSADGKLSTHLQNCLQCRRCEAACPSEVKYGELFKLTSELLNLQTANNDSKIQNWASRLTYLDWTKLTKLYRFGKKSGIIQLLRLNSSGKRLLELLPNKTQENKKLATRAHNNEGNVLLFTGCLSHLLDQQSMNATIDLLKHCGYNVKIPDKQTCCGAIAERNGNSNISNECQFNNQLAFSDSKNTPILFFTTGCGAKLKEYKEALPGDITFAERVYDASLFLSDSELFAKLQFSPLKKKVLIFNPCSERNVLKQTDVTEKLLRHIPGIELINLPKSTGCCGASGTHLLTHQQQADQIREPILEQIIHLAPDIIVGPNYPCNLHIQVGLKEKNLDIPMIHPIKLLVDQVANHEQIQ